MILYEAYDCDEQRTYHSSKAAAIKAAREMLNDDDSVWAFNSVEVQVKKIDLGKIDQAKIISILTVEAMPTVKKLFGKGVNDEQIH